MPARSQKIQKKGSFGTCQFSKSSPVPITADKTTINFTISFEEALKLSLAVDECVRKLNSYNRATNRGKNAALAVVIHLDKRRIRISEGKV
jgi:Iap family predicted aminopeptidase